MKKYYVYHTDLNKDNEKYIGNFYNLLDKNSKYLKIVLFFDDICANNLCTGHTRNGNICHSGYKIILNNNTENFFNSMSKIVHYKTFSLAMSKDCKSDNYELYVNFVISQFENRSIMLKNKEYFLKIHCIIGDQLVLQLMFKQIQNYRSKGNINACRACTLLSYEYENNIICSNSRKFLKKTISL
uniref:Uncharacterized protein n=2 Tax=Strongyloides stercoralis TaxID=6248 RepID=A0AAF5DJ98_STRER